MGLFSELETGIDKLFGGSHKTHVTSQMKQYNDAKDIKADIEKHNAGVKELEELHKKLEKKGGKAFNYDKIRYLSDYEKLKRIQQLQQQELLAQNEQKNINCQLEDYYQQLDQENERLINEMNENITDKNQIININNHEYLRKGLYTSILTTFVVVMMVILALVLVFRFGLMDRTTLIMLIIVGLIGYLIYVLYLLIQVRYFRDPYFTTFRHAMDPNITIQNCDEECPDDLHRVDKGTYTCPYQ